MKLYLVRHAQSENNVGNYTSGKETVLSKTGVEQAKRLGMFFKNKHLDKIYCSKMVRAIDTLKEIKPYVSTVPVTYTQEINERSKGIYANEPEKFDEAVKKSGLREHEYRAPEGENLEDMEKRVVKFWNYINKKYKNDTILVVAHGYFLRVLICKMFKLHIREIQYFDLHNAGVSYFEIGKEGKIGRYWIDDYKHLVKYSSYKR